jgi:hypothetical protein
MRPARVSPASSVLNFFADGWNNWRDRRARLVEFDHCDPAEMQRIAHDLGTSVPELRVLAGRDQHAADLLYRRLNSLKVDPARIDLAVMCDLQRCCANCADKVLCVHELEDRPTAATWPKYCPNEQTIGALAAEQGRPVSKPRG